MPLNNILNSISISAVFIKKIIRHEISWNFYSSDTFRRYLLVNQIRDQGFYVVYGHLFFYRFSAIDWKHEYNQQTGYI